MIPLDILVNLAAAEGYLDAGKKIEAEFYMMQAVSRTYGVNLSPEEALSIAKRVKNISSRLGGGK